MNKYGVPTTVDEVFELGQKELAQYDLTGLRKMVGVLVSAGNKRLRRLERNESKGADMYAYNATMANGGYFSTLDSNGKPKSRNALYHEIVRARQFFNSRTSTVKGAIEERKRKERSFFGETREDRAKRLAHKEAFEKKNAERIAAGKKPLKYKETKLDKAREEWKRRQARGDELPDVEDYESPTYDPAKAVSNTFLLFRSFEKMHSDIIGILGSDSVIEYMGSVATRYNGENMETLMADAEKRLTERIKNPYGNGEWVEEEEEEEEDFWAEYFRKNPDRLDHMLTEKADAAKREAELERILADVWGKRRKKIDGK